MIDKNNKGGAGEFEDDGFEGEDFDEAYFDDTAIEDSDIADLPVEDGEYMDDDFEGEDWQDDEVEVTGKKGKKQKSMTTGSDKKGMSANTWIILGGVILGVGVMAVNIMSQSSKVVSNKPAPFKSLLNVGGIMDGTLFGDKAPENTTEETAPEEQGFLNELSEETNPPQPTPISPEDAEPALTPMPEDGASTAEAPRGPDDEVPLATGEDVPVVPMDLADTLVDPATTPEDPVVQEDPSAQDILNQAMAERAKGQEVVEPAPEVAEVVEVAPVPAAVVDSEEVKALEAKLETKIEALLARMEQIENEIGSVREAKDGSYKDVEESVQSLKEEVAELRKRPAPAQEKAKPAPKKEPSVKKQESAPVVKKPVPAAKPAPAPAAWELRAAQPGRAWVSPQGSRDMQSVVVGDNLAGVGRVTAIVYQNGQWTVMGTQGQIRQ